MWLTRDATFKIYSHVSCWHESCLDLSCWVFSWSTNKMVQWAEFGCNTNRGKDGCGQLRSFKYFTEDKNMRFPTFLSKKVGGTFPMSSSPSWKVGGLPPPPRSQPIYALVQNKSAAKKTVDRRTVITNLQSSKLEGIKRRANKRYVNNITDRFE